jgi:anti-anti-sigma regulatory factor
VSDTFVHDGTGSDQVWYTIDGRVGCVVLTVGGRVDPENCLGVCDAVEVATGLSSALVVDLTRTEFLHAEAAGLVVRLLQRSHQDGLSVCVVGAPEPVGWLLRVSAETADIPTCANLTEAMAMLSPATHTQLPPLPSSPSTGVP